VLWEIASPRDDERPPIVVNEGSIEFRVETYPWKKDLIGRQWKPDQPDGKKVGDFDVKVTGADGSCPGMVGKQISIEYSEGNAVHTFRVYRQRRNGIGKHEPKLDSPVDFVVDSSAMRLTFGAQNQGRVSKVVVSQGPGGQCASASGSLRIEIQPKE
jgi:hypothetical protein